MSNPVSQYMTDNELGTGEMATKLGVSKAYASQLKAGDKPVTPRVAKALAALTGEPWWSYMPEDSPPERADA